MLLTAKKVNDISPQNRLIDISLFSQLSFFVLLQIPAEKRTKLKNPFNLNDRPRWRKTLQIYTDCSYHFLMLIFLSADVGIRVISYTEYDPCIFSDFRNSFYGKLRELINRQNIFSTYQIQFVYLPKDNVIFNQSIIYLLILQHKK